MVSVLQGGTKPRSVELDPAHEGPGDPRHTATSTTPPSVISQLIGMTIVVQDE